MPSRSRLSTTTKSAGKMPPLHPGKMLREEFMRPLGISANALAMALRVPVTRISEIVNERRSITADTALRLARYFRMPADFWMNLQKQYELETVEDELAAAIRRDVRPAPRDRKTAS
jgi:addiction module HigA family antidote